MTKFKKIFIILFISLITITVTACAIIKNNEQPDQIINKFIEANKNIKSLSFTSDSNVELNAGASNNNNNTNLKNKITSSIINDPVSFKTEANVEMDSNSVNISSYFKDNILYVKSSSSDKWIKTSDKSLINQISQSNTNTLSDSFSSFLKKIEKNAKITSNGSNYIISYSGTDDNFKEIFSEVIKNAFPEGESDTTFLNNINFKEANIEYIVNKSDFTPISSKIYLDISPKEGDTSQEVKLTQTFTFSDINKISEIKIPDDILNNTQEVSSLE